MASVVTGSQRASRPSSCREPAAPAAHAHLRSQTIGWSSRNGPSLAHKPLIDRVLKEAGFGEGADAFQALLTHLSPAKDGVRREHALEAPVNAVTLTNSPNGAGKS